MRKLAQTGNDKRLRKVLTTVENTATLIRKEAAQMGSLAEVLDHWGGLIRVTRVMRETVIDSDQWVSEIESAVREMKQRTLGAARKLRALIARHEKQTNGT